MFIANKKILMYVNFIFSITRNKIYFIFKFSYFINTIIRGSINFNNIITIQKMLTIRVRRAIL